jgi:acyl transferase domain-containing protein
MQELKMAGGMLAVFISASQIEEILTKLKLDKEIEIAALNTLNETVLSGELSSINILIPELKKLEIQYRELTVSHAFHSALMNPMLDEFEKFAQSISFSEPKINNGILSIHDIIKTLCCICIFPEVKSEFTVTI